MKRLHKLFSLMGVSLGGADTCIKYGCKDYCGYSLTEATRFYDHQFYWTKLSKHEDGELPTRLEGSE